LSDRLNSLGARLICATLAVDTAYQRFDRLRSELVLALASEGVLDRYNDRIYGTTNTYRADSPAFRRPLFPWEDQVIRRFFPAPPARLLIGGAGGGREAFALASRGYQVVAFEPSWALVETMAANVPEGSVVAVFRASYEEMPRLCPVRPGDPVADLGEMGSFDAGILGWASFSHLRTEERRVETLKAFARATHGPLLVSFWSRSEATGVPEKPGRLRRLLPGRFNRESGSRFGPAVGYYYLFSETELTAVARQAGLDVIHYNAEELDNWPHAVLARSP
jgi:SAM-dependent methyltransferase